MWPLISHRAPLLLLERDRVCFWAWVENCCASAFLLASFNAAGEYGASLWRVPESDGALQKLADLPGQQVKSTVRR